MAVQRILQWVMLAERDRQVGSAVWKSDLNGLIVISCPVNKFMCRNFWRDWHILVHSRAFQDTSLRNWLLQCQIRNVQSWVLPRIKSLMSSRVSSSSHDLFHARCCCCCCGSDALQSSEGLPSWVLLQHNLWRIWVGGGSSVPGWAGMCHKFVCVCISHLHRHVVLLLSRVDGHVEEPAAGNQN